MINQNQPVETLKLVQKELKTPWTISIFHTDNIAAVKTNYIPDPGKQQILENKQMSNNEKIQTILDKNQTRTIEKTKLLLSESFSNCNEELYNKIIINIQKHFES